MRWSACWPARCERERHHPQEEDDMKHMVSTMLGLALLGSTLVAPAHAKESTAQEVTYGAGSFFGTLLYAPAKTGFCVIGAVTSGLTLPFGGPKTAGKVASAACGGTWVITPSTLKGQEQVRFIGQ
jgi:hypothetical protein